MAGAGFDFSVNSFKGTFFDKRKVLDPVDRAIKRELSRFGAFVRRRAQTSLRYSKKSAKPGQPPRVHKSATRAKTNKKTGVVKIQPVSLLREFLFFGYEANTKTVVIGPALLRNTNSRTRSAKTIPELMEYGGDARVTTEKVVDWRGEKGNRVPITAKRTRSAKYAPHGFMNPAAEAEQPKFMESLKDSAK